MIVFNLLCKNCRIEFEGWFDNTQEYEKQKRKKLVSCPSCNSSSIKKSLMAANLPKKSNSLNMVKQKKIIANSINKYKKIIEKNFDYVGENFTEEAKKMKYGEIDERSIYGEANLEQTKELLDEDIDIVPLPWSSNKKNN
tara:strand:+ start:411 stop:830 length:420 start_codon:yes stop_codon:yes gene_type:complete